MPSNDVVLAVLRATPDALLVVDEVGSIVFANEQAERLFGWSPDGLLGVPVERLVPQRYSASHPQLRARFNQRPRPRPDGGGLALPARRRDGSEFAAEISLTTVPDAGPALVLVTVRPVGDVARREAERQQQARIAQRQQLERLEALAQLAGGVAHDFNNQLGVILNYVALLRDQVADPTARADLDEIRTAAERATELTRQLLSFARRDESHPEPVDLNAVLRDLVSELEQVLGPSIDLVVDLDDDLLVARADRRQLEQVVLLLTNNAQEAMPVGGVVRLSTHADGSAARASVVLELTDTGVGMASDVAARAFEPFFTTKPDGEGRGLGLATVHGIVRRHGGRVSIRSAPGEGTTIRIELPASRERLHHETDPEPATPRRERILLAEDEDALREATGRILRSEGYDVLVARDGVEALELFEREGGNVDLLLSDVVMPRMRGDELARQLTERAPSLRIVLVSGHDFGGAPLLGRLLDKPVSTAELLRNIREVLDG